MKIENRNDLEKLRKIKRLLIVVDMINGFVRKGVLANKEIEEVIPENIKLIEEFLNDEEGAVALVRDSHSKNAPEFKTFPEHCLEGTEESELVEELIKYEKDSLVYKKNSTNFVFAPNFMNDIKNMENLEEVVLNGCLTDYCIKNGAISLRNLFDQDNRNIEVIVDQAGVSTFNSDVHDKEVTSKQALDDMVNNGIVLVKNYGDVKWKR